MLPRTKISFLILLLVLVCSFSGSYGTSKSAVVLDDINPHFKVLQQATRKLLSSGVYVLDYHDPGANGSHDPPGKGKVGPGGPH